MYIAVALHDGDVNLHTEYETGTHFDFYDEKQQSYMHYIMYRTF